MKERREVGMCIHLTRSLKAPGLVTQQPLRLYPSYRELNKKKNGVSKFAASNWVNLCRYGEALRFKKIDAVKRHTRALFLSAVADSPDHTMLCDYYDPKAAAAAAKAAKGSGGKGGKKRKRSDVDDSNDDDDDDDVDVIAMDAEEEEAAVATETAASPVKVCMCGLKYCMMKACKAAAGASEKTQAGKRSGGGGGKRPREDSRDGDRDGDGERTPMSFLMVGLYSCQMRLTHP